MIKNKIYLTPLIILAIIIIFLAISIIKSENKNNFLKNNQSQQKSIKFPEFQLPLINASNDKNISKNSSSIEETSFSNKDLRGKISIVNFFASWCIVCIKEHHLIKELSDIYNQKRYHQKVAIFGVAWRDLPENSLIFLNNNGNYYNKVALDSRNSLGKAINLTAVPETIIINRQGEIIKHYQGELSRDDFTEIKRTIDEEYKRLN